MPPNPGIQRERRQKCRLSFVVETGGVETREYVLDAANVRELARRWLGRNRYGLLLRPAQLAAGVVYFAGGAVMLATMHAADTMRTITGATIVVAGALSALQGIGKVDFQPRPLIATLVRLGADGITIRSGGVSAEQHVAWSDVRSVERTDDVVAFVLRWRRLIVIPAPAVDAELWTQLYNLLVSKRGLSAAPIERLNSIVNTART